MRLVVWLLYFSSLIASPLQVEVEAHAAVLMNADTGAILFEKNGHTMAYPASTTKIATALFVLTKEGDLERKATVSGECLRERPLKDRYQFPPHWLDTDGAITMGLKKGEMISLESLLHGLMLISGNDAANVMAESMAGSIPKFMEMLNEYLQSIGCQNTQFRNPHGLHHPDHWSTAYDMALMTKEALQIPKFRKLVSTLAYTKPKTNKQPECELKLGNPLMKPKSPHYYPKAIGVKTGYTSAAQKTLVAAAEHGGRTLIAVVLGCEKSESRFDDVKRLFEAAFSEEKAARRLMGPENVFVKEVPNSQAPCKAALVKPLMITYFPSEEPKCKAALHWDPLHLPIRKGDKVGEVHIQDENNLCLQKGDLIALEDVKGTFFFALREKIAELFR